MPRRTTTYAIRLAVEGGGQVKTELVSVGQSGEQSLKRIESAGDRASSGLKGIGRQAELLRTGIRTLGGALIGVTTVGGLAALVDRSISAADAIGKTADKIGVGVEALQELRFAAKASGVEQQTLDMALQRFTRRAAEAAQGTGEAKDALAQMGIALRDQSGNLRRSEDLLGDVADAFARIEDPAERVRLAFKLFDSEGVALVNLLRGGSDALDEMRERARDLGIVLDEHLVRDAERARTELDTLSQVISANLTRAALEAAPVIADLSSWLADVAGKAGIAWERLFDAPEEKSLRTLRYELDLASSTIEKLEGRIQELRESPTLGFTSFLDTAQIDAAQTKIDELSRARDQTQARIAFLEGPPDTGAPAPVSAPASDDAASVQDRAKSLDRIARELEGTLFSITHEGSDRIIAEHERRFAEIEALRAQDGSNAEAVDQLIAQSAAVREAQLAGALQGAFAGGGLFGQFHEGGIAGEHPPAVRYADPGIFEHAPRYHNGGFAGSGLLPDEVPIIARRGELVVPPERVVREEKTAREQRPITVVVNVTAADASSFRASQGQIAADMARAIDRAGRNR